MLVVVELFAVATEVSTAHVLFIYGWFISDLKFIMSDPVVAPEVLLLLLLLLPFDPVVDKDVFVVDLDVSVVAIADPFADSAVAVEAEIGEGANFDDGDVVFIFLELGMPSSVSDVDDNSFFVLMLLLL